MPGPATYRLSITCDASGYGRLLAAARRLSEREGRAVSPDDLIERAVAGYVAVALETEPSMVDHRKSAPPVPGEGRLKLA